MTNPIQPAGYIITDDDAIHGVGSTVDEAWADFHDEMRQVHIIVLKDGEDSCEIESPYTRKSDYKCRSATIALIAQIKSEGGAIAWSCFNSVDCTDSECNAIPG